MSNMILSNVVDKAKLREVQTKTLNEIASYLKTSFGPFGSNTIIKRDPNAETEYTKDGHDILSMIKYNGPIESTIVDDLVAITRHVVKTVGDGTTSAVEMSNFIFQGIIELEKSGKYSAYDIIFTFKKIIDDISEKIKANGKECTLDDIYDIAYTSTNGNERLAQNLYTLYKDYGFDIYIDLQVALTSEEDIIKVYDGMTLNDGYTDPCYVNRDNAICELHNPNIYVFEDPVDTPEMIMLLDKIIVDNIMMAYQPSPGGGVKKSITAPVPTVIIAPMISADMSSYMTNLTKFIMQFPPVQRPPIVTIKAYTHQDEMSDIAMMCGAPLIKKYINDEIHKKDIESGLAPSTDTVTKFCGTCEMISVTKDTTKFIRPAKMFDENGDHTEIFNNLLSWCENELKRLESENKTSVEIYNLKRRINSLKANLIEYFVGGITVADRDNNRALLEDAIKNCRSAIIDGVGSGANVEGFRVLYCTDRTNKTDIELDIIKIIADAYYNILSLLYTEEKLISHDIVDKDDSGFELHFIEALFYKGAYNLRTKEFDGKVKTSILSDVVILNAISKIITRMATAEQFIVPSPMNNLYMAVEK